MRPDQVEPALTKIIEERYGKQAKINGIVADQLYRRIIRYSISIIDADHRAVSFPVIGKLQRGDQQMHETYGKLLQLQEYDLQTGAFSGNVGIPEPLGLVPELFIVLMSEVPGQALRQLVRNQTATPHDMELLAEAATILHQSPLRAGEVISLSSLAAGSRTKGWSELAETQPSLAGAISYVMGAAKRLGLEYGDRYHTQTHGDLHLGQIHTEGGKAWLIDLDVLRVADPAFDLTEIYTNLKRLGRKKRTKPFVDKMRDAFIRRYFASMDWSIAGRVPIYEALIHIRRAIKSNRVRDEEEWEEDMRKLVQQAHDCVQAMEHMESPHDFESAVELYENSPGAD